MSIKSEAVYVGTDKLIEDLSELELCGFESPIRLVPGVQPTVAEWDALIVSLEAFAALDEEALSLLRVRWLRNQIVAFGPKRRMQNAMRAV